MALTYNDLFRQQQALMERQRTFSPVYIGDEPPKALADAYRLYWSAETPTDEREVYCKVLALGGAPAYRETPAEVAAFIGVSALPDLTIYEWPLTGKRPRSIRLRDGFTYLNRPRRGTPITSPPLPKSVERR